VKFELDRAENSFVILSKDGDEEKYKLKLLNIALLVPVAQLAAPVFQELNSILTRKNEPKAIGIHYRRLEVREYSMPRNKVEYNSDAIFCDEEIPCRLVIAFVTTKAKVGDRHLNPYEFRRSWDVKVANDIQHIERSMTEREIYLEQKLAAIEEQFKVFQQQIVQLSNPSHPSPSKNKGKGKGKGKKSQATKTKPLNSQIEEETQRRLQIEEEAQRRLRLFLSNQFESNQQTNNVGDFQPATSEGMHTPIPGCSRMSDSAWTNDSSTQNLRTTPTFQVPPVTETTKKIFIKRVELTINGSPVDMIEDKQTEDECMQMYWRMFKYTGQMNSLATNGISYSDFRFN
jgi:hypothetical protein